MEGQVVLSFYYQKITSVIRLEWIKMRVNTNLLNWNADSCLEHVRLFFSLASYLIDG